MKTKLTTKIITFGLFITAMALLSSCGVTTKLSQNPHYHLNLVKADPLPKEQKANTATTPDIVPMATHGSLVSYNSNDDVKALDNLLKADMKVLTQQVKKSDPETYRQIKAINVNKSIRKLIKQSTGVSNNYRFHHEYHGGGGYRVRYFTLFILFLLLALLFYILAFGAGIFWVLGFISSIAAVIFFILWIVALAG